MVQVDPCSGSNACHVQRLMGSDEICTMYEAKVLAQRLQELQHN